MKIVRFRSNIIHDVNILLAIERYQDQGRIIFLLNEAQAVSIQRIDAYLHQASDSHGLFTTPNECNCNPYYLGEVYSFPVLVERDS